VKPNWPRGLVFIGVLSLSPISAPVSANTLQLTVAEDKTTGYKRSAFKHWIDADRNGCNTRAEVLIEEAIVKPKVGTKCKLTGGKWLSVYDGKTITNASQLDVDHMVPLAEAWRSGAWKWTAAQRQAFANDLENSEALIAVTLSTNRGKGDKDPSLWLPANDKCTYIQNWISVKVKYSLTVDAIEAETLNSLLGSCGFANSNSPTPTPVPTPTVTNSSTPEAIPTPTQNTAPSTSAQIVTPGAFCAPAGATGVSKTGVAYTCKTSSTDTRNRWRQ
jgi:hypothetical protein